MDVWNPKSIRSSAGSHFKIPIHNSIPWPQIPNLLKPNSQVYLADNTIESSQIQPNPEKLRDLLSKCSTLKTDEGQDLSYADPEIIAEFASMSLPNISLDSLQLQNTSNVLILGGETHGLSSMAKKCAHEHLGAKINIPLNNKIESLNVACAASVILYQFLFHYNKNL